MSEIKSYRVSIDDSLQCFPAVKSVLLTFSKYMKVSLEFVSTDGDFSVGIDSNDTFKLDEVFWNRVYSDDFNTREFNDKLILNSNDLIGTAFYFLNCLWERDSSRPVDRWGRSEFNNSIWREFGFNAPFNHVNGIFNQMAGIIGIALPKIKSNIYLTHDIDAVYSGWLENGLASVKSFKIGSFFNSLVKHLSGNPEWFNFDQIIDLEKQYNAKSTFYWIVANNKVSGIGKNADYPIHSLKMKAVLEKIEAIEFNNGIHKSLNNVSLKQELIDFNRSIIANRYHYLKFSFQSLIQEMELSGLKLDSSLGYAEKHGYRNGYSLPFVPFNLEENRPSTFLEVPLVLMDATFSRYYRHSNIDATREILQFLDENKLNSTITVLWHNTHFTGAKYLGYKDVYESILKWSNENQIEVLTPEQLIENYL